jgi:hypothetical protein
MARIIVTTDPAREHGHRAAHEQEAVVLLDERVHSVHLCEDHAAAQLIERLAWAVSDAEDVGPTALGPAKAVRAKAVR